MYDEMKNCAKCIHSAWDLSRKENICTNNESDRKDERIELFENCPKWEGLAKV